MIITKIERDGETIKVNVDVVPNTFIYNLKYITSKEMLIKEIKESVKIVQEYKSEEELNDDKYTNWIEPMVGEEIA